MHICLHPIGRNMSTSVAYDTLGRAMRAAMKSRRWSSFRQGSKVVGFPPPRIDIPRLAPAVCCASFDLAAFHSGKPDFQFRDNLTQPRMPSRRAVVVASVDPKLRRPTVNLSLRRNRKRGGAHETFKTSVDHRNGCAPRHGVHREDTCG